MATATVYLWSSRTCSNINTTCIESHPAAVQRWFVLVLVMVCFGKIVQTGTLGLRWYCHIMQYSTPSFL